MGTSVPSSLSEGFDLTVTGVMETSFVLVNEPVARISGFTTFVLSELSGFLIDFLGFLSKDEGGTVFCSDLSSLSALGGFQVQAFEKSSSGAQPFSAAKVTSDNMALVAMRQALTGLSTGEVAESTNAKPASSIFLVP